MASIEFLRPRLHGARFDGAEIPLEVLKDLASLQTVVLEVAKWRLIQDHPETRHAVPRGFANSFELKLTRIDEGSAEPIIVLTDTQPSLNGGTPRHQPILERARDIVIDTLDAISRDAPDEVYVPPSCLRYFSHIAQNLSSEEYIDFVTPSGKTSGQYNANTRTRLIEMARAQEITEPVTLRGPVPEADQLRMTFEIHPLQMRRLVIPMPIPYREVVVQAFNGYTRGAQIRVRGMGRYNQYRRLIGLQSVETINLVDPLDVPKRLDEIRDLNDGWLEGDGYAPSQSGLDWLAEIFTNFYPNDVPLPYTYPTFEGGIQMEWSLGRNAVALEIDLNTHIAEWSWINRSSDAEHEQNLNLDDERSWSWLSGEIRRMSTSET